jgi:putative endonuclease
MNFFTYIVQCSDGSYYTGFTDDVEARIQDHNNGKYPDAYTLKRRPVKLVFYHRLPDAKSAKEFERQIKGWRREKKEALIKGEWDKLPELSISYSKKSK